MKPWICSVWLVAAVEAACAPGWPAGTWTKLSPLPETPPSPRLGYEGACAWDSWRMRFVRYGGHNQGGGGEQGSEVWSFDPLTARWELHEPNISPPGVCCAQQDVFDALHGVFLRFPAFSGNHGWQWFREIYLNDASVWAFDPAKNRWSNRLPLPAPRLAPLRCASWDTDYGVAVVFGGEGSREGTLVYDPYDNTWTRMQPEVEPAWRSGGNLTFDQARHVHVLFGAQFTDDPHTWTYDLRRNQWRDMEPAKMPPTDRNDAVLAYDPHSQQVVAVVKISHGQGEKVKHRLETWLYDTGANTWRKLNPQREPDPTGNRARVIVAAPELGGVLLENRTHPPHGSHEQQIWFLRLGQTPAAHRHAAPRSLRVVTGKDDALLEWEPPAEEGVTGYVIERGQAGHPWEAEYQVVAKLGHTVLRYQDRNLQTGQIYFYRVKAVFEDGHISEAPALGRTQPAIVEEIVVSVAAANRVEISWKAVPAEDVIGYIVERAPVEVWTEDQLVRLKRNTPPLAEPSVGAIRKIGVFQRITSDPLRTTSFTDTSIDLSRTEVRVGKSVYESRFYAEHLDTNGKPYRYAVYAYRVRAANRLGVLSGPSPARFTFPPPVEYLFAREDGRVCHLKWQTSPEHGWRGYRVYRMDGRYNNAPIRRLTPEPIQGGYFMDPQAGTRTRRYYVVAVDALGQEGAPSSPVWFNREWKRFYEPFTGPWHQ